MKSMKSGQVSGRAVTKVQRSLPRATRGKAAKLPVKQQGSLGSTFLIECQLPSISEDDEISEGEPPELEGLANSTNGSDSDWLSGKLETLPSQINNNYGKTVPSDDGPPSSPVDSIIPILDSDTAAKIKVHHKSGGGGGSLGRLITEEDLLDTIFFSCDEGQTGRVPPSVLLEYVKMIMLSSNLDETPIIDDLANILDPSSMDIAIDLQTYQRAMSSWIKDIQENKPQKLIDLSSSTENDSSQNVPLTLYDHNKEIPAVLPSPIEYASFSYGNGSANSSELTRRENLEADLTNQLENLKFQVKKLSDQNSKLQSQMESTEENNSQLLNELDTIQKKLKSSELISQRSISIRQQNRELQTAMSDMETSTMATERKYYVVVEERDVLQLRVKNLMEEIEQAYVDIDDKKATIDEMQERVNKLERDFQDAQEKLALQSVELAEKSMQFEEIQDQVKELISSKEALQTEKNHLEEKVCEMKQELAIACQVLPDNLAYLETDAEMDEEEVDSPAMIHPPLTCSTPYKQPRGNNPAASVSIFSELKAVSSGNSLPPIYGLLPLETDLQTHTCGGTSSAVPDATIELLHKLQRRKEAVVSEVQELLSESKAKDSLPLNGLSKEIAACINKEVDDIIDQMKIVAKAKQLSDERAQKLAKLLAEVTDEKASLVRQFEEAKVKLQQLTYDQQQLELIKTENEILEHSIEQEKSRLSLMEQRLTDCQKELEASRRKEIKWKIIALNSDKVDGIRLADNPQISHICSGRKCTEGVTNLFDALALEVFPHKQLSQKTRLCSRFEPSTIGREPFIPAVAGINVLQSQSPLTPNCEPHIRRAKSEDSTFVTTRDHSSLSSVTSETSGFRTVDSFSAATSSVLPECDFVPRGVSLSWDHAGVGLSSFASALDSLDGNNNENGTKNSLDSNIEESNPVFDSNSDKELEEDTRVATVKIYREIAVQTVPSSGKTRKKSLPRLNLPSAGRRTETSDIERKTGKQTSPSPPSSPLLKIPRLSRPGSPHSVDSDTSLSSQLSFKTAYSSTPPPGSPAAAKYINTSREADISSEGVTFQDSSFTSQQESFHSCVEADLTVPSKSRKRMDKTIDENYNKNEEQSDSSSKLTFSLPAKTKRAVFDRKRSYSATTFDDDGSLIDLITADLAEEPLTEADKEINAKLLKESQAASERFWNRRGRKNGQANLGLVKTNTEQPEGSKATSNDGTEQTPTEQEKTTQENLKKSEKNHPSEQQVTENLEKEANDIKAEILKGAGPLPREGPISKTPKEMEKLRQENKSTHRKHMFMPKMPELVEASEAESAGKAEDSAPEADKQHPSDGEQEAKNEKSDAPPPLQRKKSSILSDALLKSLGLSRGNRKDPLKMTEKEVEMKFTDLSMAIKSSKDTLEKRVEVQTRERDLAEENMSKELDGLLSSVQKLELHIPESALYQHAAQLQQHVAMLQTMTLNLSSKAEGLGQVLQERRISTACEVMVKYVDNLRQMLDRKKAELEEAKKVIQENRLFFRPSSAVADEMKDSSTRTRRISASPLGKFNQSTRLGATLSSAAWKKLVQDEARRRASVAVFSNQSQQQDSRGRFSSLASSVSRASFGTFPRSMERSNTVQISDPKLPFSSTAEEKTKASVTFADEPTSVQRSAGPLGQVSASPSPSPLSRTSSLKMMPEKKTSIDGKDASSDESFRQGFEQGVQNQVSQELEDLREQQRIMVENLEELMDSMEEDEKEEISKSTRSYPHLSQVLVHPSAIQWVKVQKLARLAATFFLVLAACCSIVFTLMPAGSLKAGVLAFESPWSTFRQFFWPYTSLLHSDSPPR